ncbi:hypothetical protein Bca52824_034799 [Brassica carinata]|uniref:Agenet domain-containing protein n=1 Tax=Brassica carinata TaxID=52824 RepID=A0A8X7S1Y9_BRACI|nr:hypothetical protein Bca52824_034799 [Brassica carinata]
MKKLKKGSEVEVTCEKEMFKVSWNKAILQENPAKVKGKKLRVCFTTLVEKDSLSPYTETFEQCFIRPVQPEYLNKGFVFERGSVVDAYAHGGWWKSVIVKEVQNDKFLVYLDFIPDIAKFDKYQLRPNADWTGSKWQLSEDIYSPGKIVEMTRRILKMEDIWVPALLIKQIEVDGERKFIIKRMSQFLRLSDDDEEEAILKTVDICKIRPCPPQYFFAKYILGDIVEVFVSCGWLKGEVREILCGNKYLVQFKTLKEGAVYKSSALRPSMDWQDGGWIHTREDDLINDAPTPTATQERSSSTLVLESNEDDIMNGYATEIITPEESYSNTPILEATDNETPINEAVVAYELPLPHESDDACSPIIETQEIPIGNNELEFISHYKTSLSHYHTEIVQVDVKCILGDPEIHCDLVEDVDIQFGKVLDLVRRGYRLKRQDWLNGSVNIAVAEAEVEKNNYDPWIDATDKEKIEFLTKQAEIYKERVGYLEGLLNIRRENEKENGQNAERELGEEETFQSFIDSRKQQNTKVGELNENASKESVLVKKKKRAREDKEAEASTSKTKKTKTICGSS